MPSNIINPYKLTQREIVWHAVKQYPNKNSLELAQLIPSIGYSSISSVLSDLDKREMVYVSGRSNGRRTYAVSMAEYVRKELPADPVKKTEEQDAPASVAATPIKITPKIDLDDLTVREAKALYSQLKEFFA